MFHVVKFKTIEDIVDGLYNNHNGLLVATNKRFIFVSNGLLWERTVEDHQLSVTDKFSPAYGSKRN